LAKWERLGPFEVVGTGRVWSVKSESQAVEANGKRWRRGEIHHKSFHGYYRARD